MSTWTPQPAGLQEIMATVRDSTITENKEIQKSITLRLNQFTKVPDYTAYLSHILARMPGEEERIRTIAGYILKNNASLIRNNTPEVAQYVKESILIAYGDTSPMIRQVASSNVITLLGVLEPSGWPECLGHLIQSLDSPSDHIQQSAFYVLEKACEDYPRKFDVDISGSRPLDFMIPKFLMHTQHPDPKIRASAISSMSQFIPLGSQSLYQHMDDFIRCLFKLASDDNADVRKHVCQALVMLLASKPERLVPEMANVAEYMLFSTQDQNESVALEACEFWLTFAEDPELSHHLLALIPKVAPVLLKCMVYSEDDLLWLDGDEDNAAVPDKESDIKPRHYGGKAHGLEKDNSERLPRYTPAGGPASEFEEEEEYYDDDFEDDDLSTEWNLRKCSAAALDVMAVRFGGDLLNVLLPSLKQKLWHTEWLERESGILALGAMAEGCIDAIEPHLPMLIPYLVNMLNDPKPLVRSITCWTLGRYASWCTASQDEAHLTQYFIPVMEGLLRMVLDNNKRVQEAGCSAFATLEEDAGPHLGPFLEPILRNLVFAFEKYQHKNMLILYDAVGTLADAVGIALQNQAYIEILMPPLIKRWSSLQDDDDDLVPLLECLSSVAIAMGTGFLPYTGPVYERCHRIIHDSLVEYQRFQQDPSNVDEPDKSFLVVALDLLSGLVQGLGTAIAPYLANYPPQLLTLLPFCLKHSEAQVRQSAYALVGDMAVTCFELLKPAMPQIMPEVITQLSPEPMFDFISATNNAAWSVGEVALRYNRDPEFTQWVQPLLHRLIPMLLNVKSPRSLQENAAVTIGRLSLTHPEIVAPHLEIFAQNWCQALYEIKDNEEKDSAFRGFCTLVQTNPNGIAKSFLWFCNAISRWNTPSPQLDEMFRKILTGFRDMSGPNWEVQFGSFPATIQERLRARYQL